MAREKFDHAGVEKKWQAIWKEKGLYRSTEDKDKKKAYVLDMFPYPSGEGLHVGHPKGYIATDIYSRHKRMSGYSVLHPMGWDAFGLPAENYALKNKVHPRIAVEKNIENFKKQLAHIGFDYDWSREINTTDPSYYHWTQWIFLKMLEQGLAFQSNEPINWCPSCMTGLANEDLDGAVCERCGTPVVKKNLPQWVLKITDYADRMLADLDTLNWPEHIKEAQRNWIGRSEGAEIDFPITGGGTSVRVFTTRADTIYGATYLVLAPEHALVEELIASGVVKNADAVRAYAEAAAVKSEIDRSAEGKEKTGVPLEGVSAINPATKEAIPVYVADYVLGGYGTGAIMAVPAHDERDLAFAQKMHLPVRAVIEPILTQTEGSATFRADEPVTDSFGVIALIRHWENDSYIGLYWPGAKWGTLLTGTIDDGFSPEETVLKEIREETGYIHARIVRPLGKIHSRYYHEPKRQNRFGHAPAFYVELADGAREDVSAEEVAKHEVRWLSLPELRSFLTANSHQVALDLFERGVYTGPGILANSGEFDGRDSSEAKDEIVASVGGKTVVRYKLRDWVFSRQRYWGEPIPVIHCPKDGVVPVPYEDLPVKLPEVESYEPTGTGESPLAAIDEWVNTTCPKCKGPAKRETNTMPQWAGSSWYYLRFMDPHDDTQLVSTKNEKYWAPVDVYVGGDHAVRHLIYARFWHKFLYDIGVVSTREPFARLEFLGFILDEHGQKMSKSKGNVINPDAVIEEYGADAFRIYEMFMGPFENTTAWSTASIAGTARFIERLWRLQDSVAEAPVPALDALLHETVRKVGDDIESFKFNTAVSQMMIFLNAVEKEGSIGKEQWRMYLRVLAPFAPHITEELWQRLGEEDSIHHASWPAYDESLLIAEEVEVTVQVNGKRRGSVRLAANGTEEDAVAAARALPAVTAALGNTAPERVIYKPGRILNLVV